MIGAPLLLRWSTIITLVLALIFATGCAGCSDDPGDQPQENQLPGDGDGDGDNDGDPGDNDGDPGDNDGGDIDPIDEYCNPALDPDCPCKSGQFRLCSSAGDPTSFPISSACVAGYQRCIAGEWEDECIGEHIPEGADCTAPQVTVDTCNGFINEAGDCVEGGEFGTPASPNVYCADGVASGGPGDPCSCEIPEDGEEFLRKSAPCYTGPAGTLGVGICHAGTRDCQPDGSWGPCVGEQLPLPEEICGNGRDDTCSGIVDEGCEYCPPGVTNCDSYTSGYLDEPCPDGSPRNGCGGCGEVSDVEICGNGLDSNCSGVADEGCGCTGTTQLCYPGPAENAGVGECSWGIQQCQGEFWGPCVGYVLPTPELCGPDGTGNGLDNNCNGIVDDGCGCAEGDTRPCGSDVGECVMGTQTCSGGTWGPCEGGVGPQPEVCDGRDNNCNGIADDGLRNSCGQCEGPCYAHSAPIEQDDFFEEGLEFISGTDDDNPTGKDGVTLTQASVFPNYLWAANSGAGQTVSKVDTDTGLEVGRYWVGQDPSRTAVDLDGNMWVVGRNDGRVTKVLWNPTDCPGTTTSERLPDGTVTMENSATNPLADDCVVYSDTPGAAYGYTSGRGMAVDANGQIWIGYSNNNGAIQRINPSDHSDISVPSPPHNIPVYQADINGNVVPVPGSFGSGGRVYGLVADSNGYVYMADLWDSDGLPRFNTATGEWDMFIRGFDCAIYGIAVDGQDRIWVGCGEPSWADTHNPTGDGIAMFDPNTMQIHRFHFPSSLSGLPARGTTATAVPNCSGGCRNWQTTALAVEPDTGDVWVTIRNNGYVARLSVDENDLTQSTWSVVPVLRDDNGNWLPEASGGGDMRGVGFDRNGKLWHLGMATNFIFQVDPDTLQVLLTSNIGTHGHYTYSDFTGATAFNFTAPRGVFRYIFESFFPVTRVDEIFVEATVPPGTSLGVRIRPLDGDGIPISDWYPDSGGQGSAVYFDYPVDTVDHIFDLHQELGFPVEGQHFEVEIRMTRTDNDVRPFLHDLQLNWHYP